GGVAELLHVHLAYARGAGVDARWLVIEATPPFFEVTKRIHNRLHGAVGDAGPLDAPQQRIYEDVIGTNLGPLLDLVSAGDLVADEQARILARIPRLPLAEAPVVVQVSRWDRLKDMAGVMRGFVDHVADRVTDAHLVLAGPAAGGVTDDPEGESVLAECRER